ncbi:VCBS repeat-containing protein [Galbibacter sp. EGI 63066]|uniref:VCBS repeat-containing protein n=1 Tax=Galbibacter sp. EGI 63066 TaxID=2993559 RepID=UPI002249475E|nr:VCBS repeat-containing protein [Galbibacter sp. EGI 63066]MCX2678495.1 VCBS repeat-containing protein [Galbibacter sp. EGI 63066]
MGRIKRILNFFIFSFCTIMVGCKEKENTLFERLEPNQTGVSFINKVTETEQLNVMQYEYMYNGGGVGIGDFNGDGLADLYLTGNVVENKLYINKGNFKFEDVTSLAGVQGKKGWKTGISIADVNGDGLLDIYVCYSGLGNDQDRANQLFINKGTQNGYVPKFVDEAEAYGLDAKGSLSTQAAFFDYDLDGDLDMFLLNHSKTFYSPFYNSTKLRNTRHPFFGNSLYRNDGDNYVNVSESAGIHGSGLNFGLGVAISDLNQDGWPDIYVSNDYEEQDFLYLNKGDGTFEDVTKKSFDHLSKFSMGNDVADLNNDGRVDLVTLDMLPEDNYRQKLLKGPDEYDRYQLAIESGYHKQQMRNMLQLNQGLNAKGIPKFSEIGQLAGISNTDWSWAPLIADFDNDGIKDIFITNGYLRDYTNKDFMKFEMDKAIAKVRARGKELFNDKGKKEYAKVIYELVEKMPSTKIPNYMLLNQGDYIFENVTEKWGLSNATVSTGAAYADLDNDGGLDLVVSNTNEPIGIYKNNTVEKRKTNFVRVKLKGDDKNTYASGAKIWIYTDSLVQYLENYNVRGYQSSVDPVLHVGLGKSSKVDIKIQWPNGRVSTKQNIKINTLLQFDQARSKPNHEKDKVPRKGIFKNAENLGVDFVHHENKHIDFKVNRLALKQSSRSGPKMSVSDINNDGMDDIFIGGAFGQSDELFISQPSGTYIRSDDKSWGDGKKFETVASVFFDADGDGDKDLYTVSGGSESQVESSMLIDRLYLNDGNGKFQKAPEGALPLAFSNGSIVAAGDYDNDGDDDLFVGGGSIPGNYPNSDLGGILRNDTDRSTGEIKFTLTTDVVNPELRNPGLVTDAIWIDINKDSLLDLVLIGEWTPIRVFINENGKLIENTKEYGLTKSNGLWQSIEANDMDGDGDIDLIVGNMGMNTPFKVSETEPLEVYIGDFRQDGVLTPVISSYIQGKRYPIASLDELQDAFPLLKKKFLKYEQYASATLEDVFSEEQLEKAKHLEVFQLKSLYLENKGGYFEIHPLPLEVQFSAIQGIIAKDFTGDGIQDLFLVGNYYPFKVEYGPCDAGKGLLLKGNEHGSFDIINNERLGVWVEGDVRDAKLLSHNDQTFIVASKNNDSIQMIKLVD